jgi:DNA-binding transcriptional regulator YiaG
MAPEAVPTEMSSAHALRIIRELVADSAKIVVLSYATRRARQRRISRRQIELCCQRETIVEGPIRNQHGHWQVGLFRHAAGEELTSRPRHRLAQSPPRRHHVLRLEDMTYHYNDSGLDNVVLENGYIVHQTPYGEGVAIQDTTGLHKAIGSWLIATPKPLDGAELRFLRLEMELTRRDLAAILGTTEQTLRLWEKNRRKSINGSADRLVRALYSEFIGGKGSIRSMVERLAQLDQCLATEAHLRETDRAWQIDHAPTI